MRKITLAVALLVASSAFADTFTVTREDDGAGTGTLRWAIEQANATPESDTIRFIGAKMIRPASPLPEVTQPLTINGTVTIDGTNAGIGAGLVLDHSLLAYVTVQKFNGDGVVLRNHSRVDFGAVTGNTVGVRVVGNDNEVYGTKVAENQSAGIVVSAGASRNAIGRPSQLCSILCPPWPGPNTVVANGGDGITVSGDGNSINSNLVGSDFREAGPNGGDGIVISGKDNAVEWNTVSYNRGNGLTLTKDVRWNGNSGACNAGVFVATSTPRPPAPHVTSAVNDATAITVSGDIAGNPDTEYTIEFHGLPATCDGTGMPYIIGSRTVRTDARGAASFKSAFYSYGPLPYVAALAVDHVTSEHPVAVAVTDNHDHRADLEVSTEKSIVTVAGAYVQVHAVITNHGPAAVRSDFRLPAQANMQTGGYSLEKGNCSFTCSVDVLAAGESTTFMHNVRFLQPGVYHYTINLNGDSNLDTDPSSSNNQSDLTITVLPGHPRPARH